MDEKFHDHFTNVLVNHYNGTMKKVYSNRKKFTFELRMTAMIDVIFLLLIFFICTANFRPSESLMTTDLSLSGNVNDVSVLKILDPLDIDVAIIRIMFDVVPQWHLAGNECKSIRELRVLLNELRQIQRDLPVVIDSDSNVPMEYVIDTYDSCRAAGLTKIQFAAKKQNETSKKHHQ
ncbi:MAG: biopolymer transporter ExbD [Planctomycetaceae bacterium]|jgi:biopolymer transport protein ExbD|nr:biopolymer transporter ExbD [Planctomycetaceae bacterium]